jgi:hypothetical protein
VSATPFDRFAVAVAAALLLHLVVLGCDAAAAPLRGVAQYNVVWTTPSANLSYGAMPIGSLTGATGGSVWFDAAVGRMQLLLARGDAWSEAGDLNKVALVEVREEHDMRARAYVRVS